MLVRTVVIITFLLAAGQPALAADPAAAFMTKLFINVCVPNLGQPTKVREWAEAHHLGQIDSSAMLGLFVGPGGNGAAWAVPTAVGKFALSIRGMSQACAVWAQAANPDEVETSFKTIVKNIKRPGILVSVDKDTVSPSPVGDVHALVYNVTLPNAPTSFEFTMLTAQRPGGAFQASMQAARASAH